MKYIIGIDSGGTKTEAIVYDLAGNELQQTITGFGNMLVDYNEGLSNIKSAVQTIFDSRKPEDCQVLVLGLAGIDSGDLRDILTKELAEFNVPIVLLNDGQLAHYAMLKGESGVLVIAGTGSVCLGMKMGEWYRVGGWGHLFGDEGSAYYIGKRAIQQALSEYDLGSQYSILTQELFAYFQVSTVLELVKKAYQAKKDQIAGLAQMVSELSEKEPIAATILTEAGTQLAIEVEKVVKKMHVNNQPVNIALNGSVIEKNEVVRHSFFSYLRHCSFEGQIVEKEHSSAKGAYYFYKKNGESNQ